jgi:hypothetical protein
MNKKNRILLNEENLDNINEKNDSISDENQKENSDTSHKEKQHRRSRHCKEGRKYFCETCHKSYLSQSSLLNHIFKKHPELVKENRIYRRKKGRPNKYETIQKLLEEKKMRIYNSFFKDEKRCRHFNEVITDNYEKLVNIVFLIYQDKSPKKFFKCLKEPKENPILNNLINKKQLFFPICDDIFSEYLMDIRKLTNEIYFIFVLKFILIFREYINLKMINESKYSNTEYTSIENANFIPDFCNEFFSNYLTENYFGYSNGDVLELIELIQHFCRWLLIKHYSFIKIELNP